MKTYNSAGIITFFKTKERVEYLILQYKAGHWEFPKGKMENNESEEEAALRELKEETNLTATIIPGFKESFSYTFTDFDKKQAQKDVVLFVGESNSQLVVLSHEHKNFAWLAYQEAIDKVTFDNAKKTLTKADQFITAQNK